MNKWGRNELRDLKDWLSAEMRRLNMHEKRLCLNCGNVQPMNIHGRCSCCDSEAVVLAESIYQFQAAYNESVDECEKIYALEAK